MVVFSAVQPTTLVSFYRCFVLFLVRTRYLSAKPLFHFAPTFFYRIFNKEITSSRINVVKSAYYVGYCCCLIILVMIRNTDVLRVVVYKLPLTFATVASPTVVNIPFRQNPRPVFPPRQDCIRRVLFYFDQNLFVTRW